MMDQYHKLSNHPGSGWESSIGANTHIGSRWRFPLRMEIHGQPQDSHEDDLEVGSKLQIILC